MIWTPQISILWNSLFLFCTYKIFALKVGMGASRTCYLQVLFPDLDTMTSGRKMHRKLSSHRLFTVLTAYIILSQVTSHRWINALCNRTLMSDLLFVHHKLIGILHLMADILQLVNTKGKMDITHKPGASRVE